MARDSKPELRNQVIYQIFTRNYKEGTFKAVEADLQRIKALGVDYIYLVPIHPSGEVNRKGSMGSPYAIQDYLAVDPVQGTLEDFAQLCEETHKAGMKIMIDVVYNHTSPDSWLVKNHPEWFYHKEDGNLGNRVGEWWDVVDLDYDNAELWDYLIDALKMWAKYVDGFRCDVASIIPLDFWLRARKEVAEVNDDILWLAESVHPLFIQHFRKEGLNILSDAELYQAFDILYDYDIQSEMVDAIQGNIPLDKYLGLVKQQEIIYPMNYSKLRCLENHDRPRAAALAPNEKVLRNITAWIYFMKGTTMLYAGQECGETHHPTLFDLDTVKFDTGKDYSELLKALAAIKRRPIFANGFFNAKVIGRTNDIILAELDTKNGDEKAIGIFSLSGESQSITVDLPDGVYVNAIDGEEIDVYEKTVIYKGEPVIIL